MPRELLVVASGKVELREYQESALGPDEIRIKSEFAAPKHGTESHFFKPELVEKAEAFDEEYRMFLPTADKPQLFPHSVGNMAVGIVTEVGPQVKRFRVGDRVYGHLKIRETHTISEKGRGQRIYSGARESGIHKVPHGMTPEQIVCLDPAHFALAGVRDANVRLGERVAVFGLGAIGLLIAQMAVRSGAIQVFAVDPLANRRCVAEQYGVQRVLDPTTCDAALEIKKATGGKGADVVLDASGSYRALHQAIRCAHFSGLVVTVSYYHGPGTELRLGQEWHHTRVTVRSSMPVWGNPSRDHPMWNDERLELTALDLIRDGTLSVAGLVTPIHPFEHAVEAYQLAYEKPDQCVKVGIRF